MTDVREDVMNLASALGIDLSGLGDDTLEVIGLRIVAEDVLPTKPAIEALVAQYRAGPGAAETPSLLSDSGDAQPGPAPARGMHYLATEATDAKYRHRLSLVHNAEDRKTALDIRPRRPDPLGPTVAHPACIAANEEGAQPCSRCAAILHDIDCTCPACDYALGVQE